MWYIVKYEMPEYTDDGIKIVKHEALVVASNLNAADLEARKFFDSATFTAHIFKVVQVDERVLLPEEVLTEKELHEFAWYKATAKVETKRMSLYVPALNPVHAAKVISKHVKEYARQMPLFEGDEHEILSIAKTKIDQVIIKQEGVKIEVEEEAYDEEE